MNKEAVALAADSAVSLVTGPVETRRSFPVGR
jgi:hypothetical protein